MNCLFCAIAEQRRPAAILYQDDAVVAFRDINPMAPTHVLIIPRRHIESIRTMEESDIPIVGRMFFVARKLGEELDLADRGYRLVINTGRTAGQSIYHLHLHLLGGRGFRWPPG